MATPLEKDNKSANITKRSIESRGGATKGLGPVPNPQCSPKKKKEKNLKFYLKFYYFS
jgi:hypothetical protein